MRLLGRCLQPGGQLVAGLLRGAPYVFIGIAQPCGDRIGVFCRAHGRKGAEGSDANAWCFILGELDEFGSDVQLPGQADTSAHLPHPPGLVVETRQHGRACFRIPDVQQGASAPQLRLVEGWRTIEKPLRVTATDVEKKILAGVASVQQGDRAVDDVGFAVTGDCSLQPFGGREVDGDIGQRRRVCAHVTPYGTRSASATGTKRLITPLAPP